MKRVLNTINYLHINLELHRSQNIKSIQHCFCIDKF